MSYLTDRSWSSNIASGDGRGRFVLTPSAGTVFGAGTVRLLPAFVVCRDSAWTPVRRLRLGGLLIKTQCADGDMTIRGGQDAGAISDPLDLLSFIAR